MEGALFCFFFFKYRCIFNKLKVCQPISCLLALFLDLVSRLNFSVCCKLVNKVHLVFQECGHRKKGCRVNFKIMIERCDCVCVCVCQLLSRVGLFATSWTVARQAPLSLGFPRQEYWSGLLFLSPGDLPNSEIKPGTPALQADSLASKPRGKPYLK